MSDDTIPPNGSNRKPILRNGPNGIFADSRDLAAHFDKKHFHVLRDIAKLISHNPGLDGVFFTEHNIAHPTISGRYDRFFTMNRDGFSLLAMGFTGERAIAWKIDYITAFNAMEAELKRASRLPFHVRRYLKNARNVPQGYFSVLTEMFVTLFARMEAEGYELPDHMWPDISQGKMFSGWLKRQAVDLSDIRTYPYELEGSGKIVEAKCYPDRLAGVFRQHLLEVWIPHRAAAYFAEKDPAALPFLAKIYPQALPKA